MNNRFDVEGSVTLIVNQRYTPMVNRKGRETMSPIEQGELTAQLRDMTNAVYMGAQSRLRRAEFWKPLHDALCAVREIPRFDDEALESQRLRASTAIVAAILISHGWPFQS